MDQKKLAIAYHETGHAVMALLHGLKIRIVSIKGTDRYHGVMSTDPPAREITNPEEALREVRISLAGFAGEVLISGKYTIFRTHPDLTSASELVEQMLSYDDNFRKMVADLLITNPGTLTDIESPLVRAYIEGKISWCFKRLSPFKPVIQLIAEELCKKEELTGDEFGAIFNSFVQPEQQ